MHLNSGHTILFINSAIHGGRKTAIVCIANTIRKRETAIPLLTNGSVQYLRSERSHRSRHLFVADSAESLKINFIMNYSLVESGG